MKAIRFRSAISGRWVSKLIALRYPRVTVSETVKPVGSAQPRPKCPNCGKYVPARANVCKHCNSPLGGE